MNVLSSTLTPRSAPRLRQVGVITRTPARVESDLQTVLGLSLSYRYPGVDEFGLGTAYFPIGSQLFEVVHSAIAGTIADNLIEKRGGDTGFVIMLETLALDEIDERVRRCGIRVVDRGEITSGSYIQLHPSDMGGVLVAFCQPVGPHAGEPDGPWLYGGGNWEAARQIKRVTGINEVVVACKSPERVAACWAAALNLPVTNLDGATRLQLTDGFVSFTESKTDQGMKQLKMVARDVGEVYAAAKAAGIASGPNQIQICGVEVALT